MSDESQTCPSCGAHVPAGADRCELCGTSVASDEPSTSGAEGEKGGDDEGEASVVYCTQCGWENPPGARYCSQCGTELQDLSSAQPGTRPVGADLPTGEDESSPAEEGGSDETDQQTAMGRQIGILVGGAVLLVLALFFVTRWSSSYEWSQDGSSGGSSVEANAPAQGPMASGGQGRQSRGGGTSGQASPADLQSLVDQVADSLSGPVTAKIDSVRTRIEQASGGQKRQLQAELVNLLIGAGHPGRAAAVQQQIADATGTVDARRREADLLYRWMQKLQQQGRRTQISGVARHAARAYEAVANERPDDLDARTRMGETYLLTNEPMRGIQAINGVLKDDSTFVPARFQKGLALLQINRVDQAIEQFEMVKTYAETGTPFYRQAERALKVIEKQRGSASQGSGAPSAIESQ